MSMNLTVGVFRKILPQQALKKLLNVVDSDSKALIVDRSQKMVLPPVRKLTAVSYLTHLGRHLSHKWMNVDSQMGAAKADNAKMCELLCLWKFGINKKMIQGRCAMVVFLMPWRF